MKYHLKLIAFLCLLAGGLAACETVPKPVRPVQILTLEEITQSLQERQAGIHNIKSLVKTRIETPEDNHNLKQVVVIDGETNLRMDTLSLFNQPLGVLIASEGKILLYDTDTNKMYRDAEVWKIMQRIFGTVFDFREYINVFSGKIPRLDSLDIQSVSWSPVTGNYHLSAVDPEGNIPLEIQVDPQTGVPVRLIKRKDGKEVVRVEWEEYEKAGPLQFPQVITVKRPLQGDAVIMKLNNPLVNQGVPEDAFQLDVPQSN